MSLKSFLGAAIVATIAASSAIAQPTISVRDGGLGSSGRIWNVFVTPVENVGMGVELAFDFTDLSNTSVVSAAETADWRDDEIAPVGNPGTNPFGGANEGVVIDGDTVFASLGNSLSVDLTPGTESLVLSIETDDPIALLDLVAPSVLASEPGGGGTTQLFNVTGQFGIFGDFNLDGRVSAGDFGFFSGQFGTMNDPGNPADANGDGNVTAGDFGFFSGNFGLDIANNIPGSGAAIIPEPSTLSLIVFLGAVLGIRRRK